MAELIAKMPCEGLLPLTIGGLSLTEVDAGVMTSIAAYRDQADALSEAMKAAHGMTLPAANRATGRDGARALWFGHQHVLLLGPQPAETLAKFGALTDQSDAWAVVRLEGELAESVLARLVPVDLRASVFKRGHTVRTQIQHMNGSVMRIGENTFQIMVFRSMAKTLVHDLKTAMAAVVARG